MPRSIDHPGRRQVTPSGEGTHLILRRSDYTIVPPTGSTYLLTEGKVITYMTSPEICLGLHSPYSILGDSLRRSRPYGKKIVAIENATFRIVARDEKPNTELRTLLFNAAEHDRQLAEERIALLSPHTNLPERLAWVLLTLTNEKDRRIPLVQRLIADLAKGSRIVTNTALRRFERAGILTNDSSGYKINQPEGVAKLKTMVNIMNPYLLPK